MQAPSAGNQQSWHYFVVSNPQIRKELSEVQQYASPCLKAPLVIVPCMSGEGIFKEYAIEDLSASIENILLEAVSLELGGVWMGIYPREELVLKVQNILHTSYIPVALLAIGYPEKVQEQKSRYNKQKVTYLK